MLKSGLLNERKTFIEDFLAEGRGGGLTAAWTAKHTYKEGRRLVSSEQVFMFALPRGGSHRSNTFNHIQKPQPAYPYCTKIYEQQSNDSIYVEKGLFQLTEMKFIIPCRHKKYSGVSCCFRQKSYYTRVHYSSLQEKSPVCQTLRQGPGFLLNF